MLYHSHYPQALPYITRSLHSCPYQCHTHNFSVPAVRTPILYPSAQSYVLSIVETNPELLTCWIWSLLILTHLHRLFLASAVGHALTVTGVQSTAIFTPVCWCWDCLLHWFFCTSRVGAHRERQWQNPLLGGQEWSNIIVTHNTLSCPQPLSKGEKPHHHGHTERWL